MVLSSLAVAPAGVTLQGRGAARVTAAYLALALVPLAAAVLRDTPSAGDALVLLPIHLAGTGLLAAAAMLEGVRWQRLAELAPLAAIPLLYAELPVLMAAFGSTFHDAAVQQWELAMLGWQPARSLAGVLPTRWISEPLHAAYFSYYAMIYAPLAYLYHAGGRGPGVGRGGSDAHAASSDGSRSAFAESSMAVMLTFAACFAIFVIFPVQGPRYLWPAPPMIPDGVFRSLVLTVLEAGSSRGAAFPSSHMAVAVVQAGMAFRWQVPGRWLIAAATLMLGIGAVYGGFHYAIDIVTGALLGAAVMLLVSRRWSR